MKTILYSLAIIMLLAGIYCPQPAAASVYGDADVYFITDGKVVMPAARIYRTTYYASGRIENQGLWVTSNHARPMLHYMDENFYEGQNRGRVDRIVADWTYGHSGWFTFDYYNNSDSVKTMRYYYTYGTSCKGL